MKFAILGLVLIGVCHSVVGWKNGWDGRLDFSCGNGEYISRVISTHDNRKEDRRWNFECKKGFVKSGGDCSWSNYVNSWDRPLDYTCPHGGIITGLQSYHDNGKEDRRWKIRCCKLAVKKGYSCRTTGYINGWDGWMDYKVSHGQAMTGLQSWHDNWREDRRWKVKYCHFTNCHATSMRVLDQVKPSHSGRRIIGIKTEQGCSKISHTTSLSHTSAVTASTSMSSTDSKTFSMSTTMSVEFEFGVEAYGIKATNKYGFSQTFGGEFSFSKTETKSTSTSNSISSGTSTTYTGPAAVMIMAYIDEYRFNTNNVNVEYSVQCDNGQRYKERGKMNLSAKSYGKTHVIKRVARFSDQTKCSWSTEHCLANIKGHQVLYPENIVNNFAACYKGKASVYKK